MERPNILLIMSDEHNPAMTGAYGHPLVQTPHLDRLAQEGLLFENAYCNSPMCVPSRMSFLTGRFASDVNVFDNGSPLPSEVPTFAHYLEAAGYETVLCGRMHMIGPDRLHGFGKRLYDDKTAWMSLEQKPNRIPSSRRGSNSHVTDCGPGPARWLDYDRTVADLSERFLTSKANSQQDKPWLLVSSFMYPHFPLWTPHRYFDRYPLDQIVLPDLGNESFERQHPVIQHLRYFFRNQETLDEETLRTALASYYALVTLTDEHIGRLLRVVDQSHLHDNTVVIYLSDHGEMAGEHGIWQKQCFYEGSVRVPLMVKGPGLVKGQRIRETVSLVDILPTLLDLAHTPIPGGLRGESLTDFLTGQGGPDRTAYSEYHAQGMLNGGYMLKEGRFKYNYYVGARPQLFDLITDPKEFVDLAQDPHFEESRQQLHRSLVRLIDPEEVDRRAKDNQQKTGMARAYSF
jgi:choline-sulfatase